MPPTARTDGYRQAASAWLAGTDATQRPRYLVAHSHPPVWLPLADEGNLMRRALIATGQLVPAAVPGVALSPTRHLRAPRHHS